jgi:hypothetical protein
VRSCNLDHAIVARTKQECTFGRVANDFAFEDVHAFFNGVHMRADFTARLQFTDSKLLVD